MASEPRPDGPWAVYVVAAFYGEYSDHREWLVCAYLDQAQAIDHAVKAQGYAQAVHRRVREEMQWDGFAEFDGDEGEIFTSPFDPDPPEGDWYERRRFHEAMTSSYGSTIRYEAYAVPVRSAVPDA